MLKGFVFRCREGNRFLGCSPVLRFSWKFADGPERAAVHQVSEDFRTWGCGLHPMGE
jgi:hypothetical protein